jgi:tight adherence protein B
VILARRHSADESLPAVLDHVAAALRSGGAIVDGLEAAAGRGDLAPALRGVLLRVRAGMPLRDALRALTAAHPTPGVRFAVAAMCIALDTGGAHADALDAVAQRVRDQLSIEREVRALSASARVSAVVIVAAPLGFGLVVLVVDRAVVIAALGTAVGRAALVVGLCFQAGGAWWMRRLLHSPGRRVDAADDAAEVADLFALAIGGGCSVPAAIAVVAAALDDGTACGRLLRTTAMRSAAGHPPADVLGRWPAHLGDGVRPMVSAMVAAHDVGAPAVTALVRTGADLRHARRQRAAERSHRLPVLLLFPLVCCVLPAFVLLAVVPITVGSIRVLQAGS